jgi:osmotically-inducible protein OsmY
MRSSRAFLIGIGAAYFFDPRLGKRRRTVARDRGGKTVRRIARNVVRKKRFVEGRAHGLYARGRNVIARPEVAGDDATVEQRIRSEALRDLDSSARDVEIAVEDGVATVTGTVADDKRASELIASVGKVAGVEDVAAMLRVENKRQAA